MFKLNFLLATIIMAIKVSSAAESEPPSKPSFLAFWPDPEPAIG